MLRRVADSQESRSREGCGLASLGERQTFNRKAELQFSWFPGTALRRGSQLSRVTEHRRPFPGKRLGSVIQLVMIGEDMSRAVGNSGGAVPGNR